MSFADDYKAQRDAIAGKTDAAERERRRVEMYRHTFLKTDVGRAVLADMLYSLSFFSETVTEEETHNRNYATKLLYELGIFRPENVGRVIDALATIQFTGGSDT